MHADAPWFPDLPSAGGPVRPPKTTSSGRDIGVDMPCLNLRRSVCFALPSIAVLLTACGDSGGRVDSDTSPTATEVSSLPTTPGETDSGPDSTPTTTDNPGSMSASAGETTTTESTTAVTATESGPDTMTTGTMSDTNNTSTNTESDSDSDSDSDTTGDGPCPQGDIVCEDGVSKVCDGMGGFTDAIACPNLCIDGIGCVECEPGAKQCAGDVPQVCANDGSAWIDGSTCDPVQGLSCDANAGTCVGACANLGTSYIGCDYYPVVTQQLDSYVGPGNPFAVAVANTTDQQADITITRGANQVLVDTVAAGSVKVINLPWVNELAMGTGPTVNVPAGAYRLRSTRPVTVYQFNPLNASVTNDASLMLPVNTWTGNYLVAAWQHWNPYPGFYSVTASQDNTAVTVKAPKGGVPTQAGAGVDNQGNGVVMLNAGDVLQVVTANGGDLTGSIIAADKPVQVLGGHDCTQVPIGTSACDHLEESMFPIEALAKQYIIVPPVQVPNDNLEKAIRVRIVAAEDNTTLTFEPDQPVAKVLANAGDFVETANSTAKYVVSSDKKILVAQYMVGQSAGFGTSDPAMVVAVPSEQYRTSYLFYAQTAWQANYVDIIAPNNATVDVDGANVANFNQIGASGFSVAHVKLSNTGTHTVNSNQKVGISVYGVVSFGSYWYPGGLDLDVIPQ